jgi:hypothetical protein
MEMSQGIFLHSYLKQTKMSCFLFYKIRVQEGETGPFWGEGVSTSGRGRMWRKGAEINMMKILCTHICKETECWDGKTGPKRNQKVSL